MAQTMHRLGPFSPSEPATLFLPSGPITVCCCIRCGCYCRRRCCCRYGVALLVLVVNRIGSKKEKKTYRKAQTTVYRCLGLLSTSQHRCGAFVVWWKGGGDG